MRLRFAQIVDVHSLHRLLLSFYKVVNVRCAVCEADGERLATSGMSAFCLRLNRQRAARRKCFESDILQEERGVQNGKYTIYRCPYGLMKAAAPVMVAGSHMATVFLAQVFCERPDLEWHRQQARELGIDEFRYLSDLKNIRVIERDKLEAMVAYLSEFAELLGELGFRQMKQLEAQETIRESENKYRSIFENAVEGFFRIGPDGRFAEINPALARMHGFNSPQQMTMEVPSIATHFFADRERKLQLLTILEDQGVAEAFEAETFRRDGSRMWVNFSVQAFKDKNGKSLYHGIVEDISERKRAEFEMRATQDKLKELSQSLLKRMETERHYIAYELHDQVGQALTAVRMNLESMRVVPQPREFAQYLKEGIQVIDDAMEQVRSLSLNLRPSVLDDLGLTAALRWFFGSIKNRGGLQIRFRAERIEPRLSKEIETACFRIAQEAATNVIRHAQASRMTVGLAAKGRDWVRLTLADNGVGFDMKSRQAGPTKGGGFGLIAMEERVKLLGGTFEIASALGQGTAIVARFPKEKARSSLPLNAKP